VANAYKAFGKKIDSKWKSSNNPYDNLPELIKYKRQFIPEKKISQEKSGFI
jgi:hypothetical protein